MGGWQRASWWSISSPTPIHFASCDWSRPCREPTGVIRLELGDERQLVVHAMKLRPIFHHLLLGGDEI